jgi:hypothetical protein
MTPVPSSKILQRERKFDVNTRMVEFEPMIRRIYRNMVNGTSVLLIELNASSYLCTEKLCWWCCKSDIKDWRRVPSEESSKPTSLWSCVDVLLEVGLASCEVSRCCVRSTTKTWSVGDNVYVMMTPWVFYTTDCELRAARAVVHERRMRSCECSLTVPYQLMLSYDLTYRLQTINNNSSTDWNNNNNTFHNND